MMIPRQVPTHNGLLWFSSGTGFRSPTVCLAAFTSSLFFFLEAQVAPPISETARAVSLEALAQATNTGGGGGGGAG